MVIEYWYWLVLGILLVGCEMIVPSFVLLWFGAGALLTGVVMLLVPISLTVQVVIWTLSSVMFTGLWFKYLKPLAVDKTKAGSSAEKIINETGMVILIPANDQRGMMRFLTPKLGSEEWAIICDDDVVVGDRVRVKSVSGNSLIVEKC